MYSTSLNQIQYLDFTLQEKCFKVELRHMICCSHVRRRRGGGPFPPGSWNL